MLDPKAISQYYNKIIDVVKTINSVQSEEKQKLPNMTFGKLIAKGHALHNLKIDGQGIPPDGSSTKSLYKKKIELHFSTPDIESIEGSDLREGENVFILMNKQPSDCFKPDINDLRGTVSKIEDNRITIEANVEMNFDIDDYSSKDMCFVIYDEYDSSSELDNLKHLSETGDFCNQSLLSLIIKSDQIAIMDEDDEKFHPINNETAIKEALRSENLYLIHGPPGTGKTLTCAKIIADFILKNPKAKVLVTAQSNKAIDNLLLKLSMILPSPEEKITRYGRSFKFLEGCRQFTIKQKIEKARSEGLICNYQESLDFKEKIKEQTRIFFCTPERIQQEFTHRDIFDLVIIDEASTIIESACLIPICRAKKLIMAGDHKQLGPTIVKSEIATDPRNEKIKYFERTLFQKLIETNADKCCILNEQHRMNDTLIKFPNISFYKGVLKSDEVVKFSELHIFFDKPIIFINHKGKEDSGKGTSFSNKDEAKIVSMITNKYNSLGIDSKMLGVISFYKNQKLLINRLIRKTGIKCMTVDSYQGEEKNIIILSTVRSNDIKKREESLGFLIDYHRLNVSLTRAKNKLIIIGNETTLKRDEMTSELIEYIKNNGIFIDSSELTKKFIKPTNKEYKEAIQEKKILAEGAYQAKLALMTKSNFEDIKKKADLLLLEDNIFSGMDEY